MENIHILEKKQLGDLTVQELLDVLKNTNFSNTSNKNEQQYVYGITGIQQLLNCSESKAKRLKKSGIIDDAIIQNGRKIIVDKAIALELLRNNKPGRKLK